MIIAVSGLAGSGKNTFGTALAKKLGYRIVCPTFKDLADSAGVSLLEFQKMAHDNPEIDKQFDTHLKQEADEGNCIVTTWLGPWIVNADYRIWINAPSEVRAERLAKREGSSVKEALEHIQKRDADNRARYLKLYGIDILEHKGFDLILNSEKNTPQKMVELALNALKKDKKM